MRKLRYRNLAGFYRQLFGQRVHKVGLRGGFECPNRDGTLSRKGCVFCNPEAALSPNSRPGTSITEQLKAGTAYVRNRFGAALFIAYLQDYTATYADPDRLEALCREAIDYPGVVGLSLGTRPDCLPSGILRVLKRLADESFLEVELGVQTASDHSLSLMRRGHDSSASRRALRELAAAGVRTSAHVILGLPGESSKDQIETAALLRSSGAAGVKIHNLHVVRGTELETLHRKGLVAPPTLEDYCGMVVRFLEQLPPEMVVSRLVGDAPRRMLLAPEWALRKHKAISAIRHLLKERDSWQGKALGTPLEAVSRPLVFARRPRRS